MPHASGIIYIDTSTTPHKGVSIADIQQTLGTGAYNTIGGLITYGNINKWAKYKPVRLTILNTDGQLEEDTTNHRMVWKSSADWWRGSDDLCGFSIPTFDSAADLDGETGVWQYLRPRGLNGGGQGVHEWFRFKDFNQYDHNCVIPFSLRLPESALTTSATMVQIMLTQNLASGNLSLDEIGDFGDCYFGVAMFKDNNSPYFKTASKKLSVGDVDATKINIEDIPFFTTPGTVRIYTFIGGTQASNNSTRQYDHDIWFLNAEDGMAYREVLVQAQAQNVYSHGIGGFTPADRKVLGPATISITGGVFHATRSKVGQLDFSKTYTLYTVIATAKLHSTGAVVSTQSLSVNSSAPDTLEPGDPAGASYTFYCPMPTWTLPTVSDPDDYYDIMITFNYQ